MGAAAIDLNNTDELVFEGRRVLAERFGNEGAKVFLDSYVREHTFAYPRISAEEFAAIKAEARAESETFRGKGEGDYTKEKYEEQDDRSFDEIAEDLYRIQDKMHELEREHPEMTLWECGVEAARLCSSA